MARKKRRRAKRKIHPLQTGAHTVTGGYYALKRAYHAAGERLFKSRHGGKTARQWAAAHKKTKKRRAKHKRSR